MDIVYKCFYLIVILCTVLDYPNGYDGLMKTWQPDFLAPGEEAEKVKLVSCHAPDK